MSRHRAVVRLLLAVLVVVAVVAGPGASGAGARPSRPAQGVDMKTPDDDAAVDDLVGCVQGTRHLLVLFLIDESASLKKNDPDDRRVDAAESALDSLQALAAGDGPTVEVALAGFSNEYVPGEDWTAVDAETGADLRTGLEAFRERNSGIDTDFVNALSAGREALADRSAEVTASGDVAPCKAVLLFTDGGYDIAVRGDDDTIQRLGLTKSYAPGIELTSEAEVRRAEKAGREAMCKVGGLADQVRGDEITLLTLALAGDVAAKSQRLLAAASAGQALGYTCGAPRKRPPGSYLPASGIDVLIARFDEVATRLAGGTRLEVGSKAVVCGEDPCPEGTASFELDDSLRRAHVLALPAKPGISVELTGPAGSTTISEAGTTDVGGVSVETSLVAGRGLSIDLDRPASGDGWAGAWSAAVIDPSGEQAGRRTTLQVFVFSDVRVALTQEPVLERGGKAEVSASISVPKGTDPEAAITEASAVGRFVDPITGDVIQVDLAGPPEGPFTGELAMPASITSNSIEATIELRATTRSGARLVAQSAPTELLVRRPGGAIQFGPPSLALPSVTNLGSTSAEVVVVGGDRPGCYWFGPAEVPTLPDGAGEIRVTIDGEEPVGEAACVPIEAKGQATFTVEATPTGRASGTVAGTLELHEKVEGGTASTTQLGFRFDLARGVDEARRLLLSGVLLAGGLLIPVLLLLIINSLGARFQTLDAVRGAVLPVGVRNGSVVRLDGAGTGRMTLGERDFGSLAGAGSIKRFRFGGVEFRAKASRNPFGATMALAAPEGGAEKLKGNEGSRIELDPGLSGSWVFLLDADKTRASRSAEAVGTLIAFVAEGDVPTQTARMLPDIEARLPKTGTRLASLVRKAAPKPAKPARASRRGRSVGADAPDDAPDEGASDGLAPLAADPGDVGDPGDAGVPAVEADDAVPSTDRPADEADGGATAPAVPLGFGGTAAAPPPPVADAPADAGSDDDGPPIGFGGRRPPT